MISLFLLTASSNKVLSWSTRTPWKKLVFNRVLRLIVPVLLASISAHQAWAETGSSRSVCTHTNSELPRIIEVLYENTDSPLPCKVMYEKNGSVKEVAAARNSQGHCEKTERKIVINLVKGGYECKHEFNGLGSNIDSSVILDLFSAELDHADASVQQLSTLEYSLPDNASTSESDHLESPPKVNPDLPAISANNEAMPPAEESFPIDRMTTQANSDHGHLHEFVHSHPLLEGAPPQSHKHVVHETFLDKDQTLASSDQTPAGEDLAQVTRETQSTQSPVVAQGQDRNKFHGGTQSSVDVVEAEWALLTRALPDETYAQRLSGELRRRMPHVETRVVEQSADSPVWHVALGVGNDADLLQSSLARLDAQVQSMFSVTPLAKDTQNNTVPVIVLPSDWARYAMASCWADGFRTSDTLSQCSSVVVNEGSFINCFGGAICAPTRYDSEKVMNVVDFIEVLGADDPVSEARDRITRRVQGCELLSDVNNAEFAQCATLSIMDDTQRAMFDCYQRNDKALAMIKCAGNDDIASYANSWERCSSNGYDAAACLLEESDNTYLQSASYCLQYEEAADISRCAIETQLSEDNNLLLSCLTDYSNTTDKATCLAREKLDDNEYAAVSCASLADNISDYTFCVAQRSGSVSDEALYSALCFEGASDLSAQTLLECGGSQYVASDIGTCLQFGLEDPRCFDSETVISDLAYNNLQSMEELAFLNNEITRFRQEMFALQGGDLGIMLADGGSAALEAAQAAAQTVSQATKKSESKIRRLFKFGNK